MELSDAQEPGWEAAPIAEAAPAQPDPSAAAFFDIDNTLIHGASMFHWARGLAKHKYLSKGQILDFVWKQTRFIVVGKEHAEDLHDVTEEALALVEGRDQAELVQLTREIFNEYMIDRFWPGTVALAQGHLDAGQRVWLVSAAPVELAELIAEHLGLSGALGTVSEQVNGIYTGRLEGRPLHGEAKAEAIHASKPFHIPDTQYTEAEYDKAFNETLGSGRIYLFDHFGSTSVDNIINRVRYMAKGLGCRVIVLDHISIVVSAQDNGDERKAIDEIMTKLRMLVQETGIALICVSHLKRPDGKGHEEGATTSLNQLRGSGSIGQLSDMVLGLERNGQAEDSKERNTTRIRVVKNRFSGLTGPAGACYYDHTTGRMSETTETEETL